MQKWKKYKTFTVVQYLSGPVHTTISTFKKHSYFCLPSTRIRYDNGFFENTGFVFLMWGGNVLKTELSEIDAVTIILWYPCQRFPQPQIQTWAMIASLSSFSREFNLRGNQQWACRCGLVGNRSQSYLQAYFYAIGSFFGMTKVKQTLGIFYANEILPWCFKSKIYMSKKRF